MLGCLIWSVEVPYQCKERLFGRGIARSWVYVLVFASRLLQMKHQRGAKACCLDGNNAGHQLACCLFSVHCLTKTGLGTPVAPCSAPNALHLPQLARLSPKFSSPTSMTCTSARCSACMSTVACTCERFHAPSMWAGHATGAGALVMRASLLPAPLNSRRWVTEHDACLLRLPAGANPGNAPLMATPAAHLG